MALSIGLHVGLDDVVGTVVDTEDGTIVETASQPLEHAPAGPRRACDAVLLALRGALGARARNVAAMATCGADAFVALDADGVAITAPMPWADLIASDAARDAATLLSDKDDIGLYLTGRRGSDDSAASCMGDLFDGASRRWSPEALDAAGMSGRALADTGASIALLGRLTPERAEATGLPAGT